MFEDENRYMFLCDRRKCTICTYPICRHTTDPKHAVNFDHSYCLRNLYIEKDSREDMDISANTYQSQALRFESGMYQDYPQIVNGLMGLNGEAGEAIDILKKHLFQGHDLDREHLAKELGDVAWYLAVSADALGYKLSDILKMNIDKLSARYPNGFEDEKSIHRTEGDE